jgi:hypothetical protein
MAADRPPESMPTDWTIASFSHERGFGTLRHAAGDEVPFSVEAWTLGDWKPTRQEAQMTGPDSPLYPRPGEPVRVTWRRTAAGKTVPRAVEPTGRVSVPTQRYTLRAWLDAVRGHGERFTDLTEAGLLAVLAEIDEDLAEEWGDGEPREASDYAYLLMHLAHHADQDQAFRGAHAGWIYADDHRWDRNGAQQRLPTLLGLPPGSVPTAGDGITSGQDESLGEYAEKCNTAAASRALLLHEVDLDGDELVFVCMTREAFDALVTGGYLARAEP